MAAMPIKKLWVSLNPIFLMGISTLTREQVLYYKMRILQKEEGAGSKEGATRTKHSK